MAKNKTAIIVITAIVLAVVLAVTFIVFPFFSGNDEEKYNEAKTALSAGEYSEAYNLFREIKGYADTDSYLKKFKIIYDKEITDDGKTVKTVTNTFDESGRLIEITTEAGSSTVKTKYDYDSDGKLTAITKDTDGTEKKIEEYFYDTEGNLIKEMLYDDGALCYICEHSYKDGKRVKSNSTLNIGGFITNNNIEYFYNGDELIKDVNVSEYSQITTEYDNGLIIKATTYSVIDGTTSYTDYSYDGSSNLLSVIHTSPSGSITQEENTYDNNGNILTKKLSDAYGVWYEMENKYDGDKLIRCYISQRTKSDPNSSVCTDDEYYDRNGNLIKKISERDGESKEAVYSYDNRNNPVTITKTSKYSKNSISMSTSKNEYDKMNNLIKTEETVKTVSSTSEVTYNTKYTYIYTYDSFGNLLTSKQSSHNTLTGSKSEKSESFEYHGVRVIYDAEAEE